MSRSRPLARINYRLRMAGFMLFADLSALALAALAGKYFSQDLPWRGALEVDYLVYALLCLSLFAKSNLYPGAGVNPANEIKLVSQYAFNSLLITALLVLMRSESTRQRLFSIVLTWAFSILFVVALRWLVRIVTVQWNLWREPVLIVAKGNRADYLANYFRRRLRFGFLPALLATDDAGMASYDRQEGETLISLSNLPASAHLFEEMGVQTALVDLSAAAEVFETSGLPRLAQCLPHLIFISDLNWIEGASLTVRDFEGILGVEANKNALSPIESAVKVFMDFSLSWIGLIFLLPLFLLVALLIKLDSPGPVFYLQERIGKNGRKIKIIKFRTMTQNAEETLRAYLQANPQAKREWEETQKLKADPRVTRVGRWLRLYSIDELPQILNVCKGEMSLVGPRPITPEQIELYGERITTYYSMKPGMSGLWQVSGRNNVSFQERSRFDVYYIWNWSIWLDVYILLRTVWVVLFHVGAY